jgi:hypothetical protein
MFDDFKELLSIFNAQKVKRGGASLPRPCPNQNYAAVIIFFIRSFISWGDTSST